MDALSFLVPTYTGCPGKEAAKLVSVCLSVCVVQGGFEYKRAIVDSIISIIEENSEAKEAGLAHLCEFIEDCEHTVLATRILHLLGREGPRTPQPFKYVRFIYNRVILENPAVRAGLLRRFISISCCL